MKIKLKKKEVSWLLDLMKSMGSTNAINQEELRLKCEIQNKLDIALVKRDRKKTVSDLDK